MDALVLDLLGRRTTRVADLRLREEDGVLRLVGADAGFAAMIRRVTLGRFGDVDKESLNAGRARYLADDRDTATPSEIVRLLGRLQLGDLLPRSETDLLLALMAATKTGSRRLKGRLPAETMVAHKTGTTAVVINDAGIITLPQDSKIGGHIALAIFIADGSSIRAMERAIAQLSAAAFEFFTGRALPQPRPAPKRRHRR
jgi:beta-lactamase class A